MTNASRFCDEGHSQWHGEWFLVAVLEPLLLELRALYGLYAGQPTRLLFVKEFNWFFFLLFFFFSFSFFFFLFLFLTNIIVTQAHIETSSQTDRQTDREMQTLKHRHRDTER